MAGHLALFIAFLAVIAATVPAAGAAGPTGRIFFDATNVGVTTYVVNADGTGLTPIGPDPGFYNSAVSPDGRSVALRSPDDEALYVIASDGSTERRLTDTGIYPAWSPDGKRLAFFGGATETSIQVINTDGTNKRTVLRKIPDECGSGLSWSPDMTRLGFVTDACDSIGPSTLYLLTLGSGTVRRVTDSTLSASAAQWSPDGQQMLFSARGAESIQYGIYTANADGSKLRRLTDSAGSYRTPAWSPDGTLIVYVAEQPPPDEKFIGVMHLDGSNRRTLYKGRFPFNPVWSPDGNYIAFVESDDTGPQLFVMEASGANVRRLTTLEVISIANLQWVG